MAPESSIRLIDDVPAPTGTVAFVQCGATLITGLWYQTHWWTGKYGNIRRFATMWRFSDSSTGNILPIAEAPGQTTYQLKQVQGTGGESFVALDLGDHYFALSKYAPASRSRRKGPTAGSDFLSLPITDRAELVRDGVYRLQLHITEGVYEYAQYHLRVQLLFDLADGRVVCSPIGAGSAAVHVD